MAKAIKIGTNAKGQKFALCHLPMAWADENSHQQFKPAFAVFTLKTNHEHGVDRTRWLLVNNSHTIDRAAAEAIFNKRTGI